MPNKGHQPAFAPQLIQRDGAAAIEFYKKAFGIVEVNRWSNEDGTVHVAELSFQGTIFICARSRLKNQT
jgi:PhnB protein